MPSSRRSIRLRGAEDARPRPSTVGVAVGVGTVTISTPSSGTDPYFGYTPGSGVVPPVLTEGGSASDTGLDSRPWHTNTGVITAEDRATCNANIVSSFSTSAAGQLVSLKRFTGPVNVNHANVTFERCIFDTGTDGTSANRLVVAAGVYSTHPEVIHCDIGTGRRFGNSASDGGYTFNRGPVSIYRSNIFDVLDGIQVWDDNQTIQDNFIHDVANGFDSGQSSGTAHNDCIQLLGATTAYLNILINNNTFWCWSRYIRSSATSERATRSLGPHWYNTDGDQQDSNGYQSSGIQIGGGASTVTITNNTFRGHAAVYINGGTSTQGTFVITDNLFSSGEQVSGNRPRTGVMNARFGGTTDTRLRNVYGPWDSRAGQAVT